MSRVLSYDAPVVGNGTSVPHLVEVTGSAPSATETNFPLFDGTGGAYYSPRRQSSGAQNDAIGWDILLAAGTHTFRLAHNRNSNRGIYTVSFDGTTVGTIDGYASSASWTVSDITGIAVPADGIVRVLLTMATKNASSSDYFGNFSGLSIARTGA